MKIAERDLLFPNKKDKKVYKCIDKNDLSSGLCVIDSDCGIADFIKVFPKNKYDSVYKKNICDLNNLIVEKVIKYKVFNFDELLFLKEYEGKEKLDLDTLLHICKDFEYSTFIVDEEVFLDLVTYVNDAKDNFKFGGVVSTNFRALDHTQEYICAVSIYDVKAVITNIYNEPFVGICISFELINKGALTLGKRITAVSSHYILTNSYEGIFYKDGETVHFEHNFIETYRSFSSYTTVFKDYKQRRDKYIQEKAHKIPEAKLKEIIKKHKADNDLFNLDDLNYEEAPVKHEAKYEYKMLEPELTYFNADDPFQEAVPAEINDVAAFEEDNNYIKVQGISFAEIEDTTLKVSKKPVKMKIKSAEEVEKMLLKYKHNFGSTTSTTENNKTSNQIGTKINYFTVGYGGTSVTTYNA